MLRYLRSIFCAIFGHDDKFVVENGVCYTICRDCGRKIVMVRKSTIYS